MMKALTRGLLAAMAAGTLLTVAACGGDTKTETSKGDGGTQREAKKELVVAAIPSENSKSLHQQFETTIKVIEKEAGVTVKYQDATDYSAVIEGQRAGKIDVAMYGPFSYTIAKGSGVEIEPLAAAIKKKGAAPGYYSTAWVKADSKIADIKDFKGKKICFVEQASTSGYLYPSAGLLQAGLDPKGKDITPVFAGAHDASLLAVASGQCEAGFAQDSQMKTLVDKNQLKDGQLKQVWKSDMIAGSPAAVSTKTVSADLRAKLADIFVNKLNVEWLVANKYCASEKECKLPESGTWGYAKVDDKIYDGVRKVCETTKADACKQVKK